MEATTGGSRLGWRRPTLGVLVCAVSCLYLLPFVDRGWVPHDDGGLAESARRVLAGELPHRDFEEVYTGGLSYLHAGALALLGPRLLSLRFCLLAFAVGWIAAVWGIARRVASPPAAALVTAVAVAWSLPNYFASLPSWYNLFFATFGTLALLRHVESGGRRWLFVAGACGGLSILAKSAGAFYVAAALLFLVYREQLLAPSTDAGPRSPLPVAIAASLATVLAAALALLVRARPAAMEIARFLLPQATLAAVVVLEARRHGGAAGARLRALLALVLPFAAGVAVPLLVYVAPYAAGGSLGALAYGLFVTPRERFASASMALPGVVTLAAALPYGIFLVRPPAQERTARALRTLTLGLLVVTLALSTHWLAYRALWNSARHLTLAVVLGAIALLVQQSDTPARQRVFLLVAMAGYLGLVEFPFSSPGYFIYSAPMVALAALALVGARRTAPTGFHAAVACGYLVFAVLRLHPGYIWQLGWRYEPYEVVPAPALARAGLRVPESDRAQYEALLATVAAHRHGDALWAGPGSPEVYFLTATRNPTRIVYDFLDEPSRDPVEFLALLERNAVDVAVVNRAPSFSPPLPPPLLEALWRRYPVATGIGRFVVSWRP